MDLDMLDLSNLKSLFTPRRLKDITWEAVVFIPSLMMI